MRYLRVYRGDRSGAQSSSPEVPPPVTAHDRGSFGRRRPRNDIGGQRRRYPTSNNPAAPIPPPTHIVTTTYFAPRRLPSISAWPVIRAPDMP